MQRILNFLCVGSIVLISGLSAQQTDAVKETDAVKQTDAGEVQETESVRSAIADAIESYMSAFNEKDVEKLVALWSPEGVYISRSSGDRIVGREALSEEFTRIFSGEDPPKLVLATDSIDFISPNVALERGAATVTRGDAVSQTTYRAVYVRRGDAWLIDRVTEEDVPFVTSNYRYLKDLEWMIGEWVDNGDGVSIELDCQWAANQNFISRRFSVSTPDGFVASGLQIIGWDAAKQRIRSWLFDSDGGYVSGIWTKRDDRWIVQSVATLADGALGSFTSVFRPIDDGRYAWQKINQVLDGKILPNIDEVEVLRK